MGVPHRTWSPGELLDADLVRTHLQDQVILQFADAASRDATVPASRRVEGMTSITTGDLALRYWSGSAWAALPDGEMVVGGTAVKHVSADWTVPGSATPIPGLDFGGVTNGGWVFELVLFVSTGSATILLDLFGPPFVVGSGLPTVLSSNTVPQLILGTVSWSLGAGTWSIRERGFVGMTSTAGNWGPRARLSGGSATIKAGSWMSVRRTV